MSGSDLSIAPSARRITDLAQTSAFADDDAIVVERPGDSTYSASLGMIKELVSQEAKDCLELGSAAYTEPYEYAPLAHAHDYSDFDFFPSYKPDDGTITVEAGAFVIKKHGETEPRRVEIRVPVQDPVVDTSAINPRIGELRMLGVPDFGKWLKDYKKYGIHEYSNGKTNIDINDPSFDGWVIPNGTTFAGFAADEFAAARQVYGNSDGSFTVPDLSGFFKCYNNKNEGVEPMSVTPGRRVVRRHIHELADAFTSQSIQSIKLEEFALSAKTAGAETQKDIQNSRYVHSAGGNNTYAVDYDFKSDPKYYDSKNSKYLYKSNVFGPGHWGYLDGNALNITRITCSDGGINVTISNSGSQLVEQFPDYQEVPALIYIGKKK